MPELELTNMIMIQHPETKKVAAIDRAKSPFGLSCPAGMWRKTRAFTTAPSGKPMRNGTESKNLIHCGVIHWLNLDTQDRYLVFCIRPATLRAS